MQTLTRTQNSATRRTLITRRAAALTVAAAIALTSAALTTPVHADGAAVTGAAITPVAMQTQTANPRLRLRIAIDQSKWEEIRSEWCTLPRDVREGVQAELLDKLVKSGYFQVMERERTAMQQMSQEDAIAAAKNQNLQNNGNGGATPAAREARTPARYIITPTITDFSKTEGKKKGFSFGGISVGGGKSTVTLRISIRISDAETGAIIDSQIAEGKNEAKSSAFSINLGGIGYGTDKYKTSVVGLAVEEALNDAVSKIVGRLGQESWSAAVALQDEETGRVFINAGSEAGVAVGQEFAVFKTGKIVRDPETGEIISRGDETKIGSLRVVRVEKNSATCEVKSGKTFAPRNIVRLTS